MLGRQTLQCFHRRTGTRVLVVDKPPTFLYARQRATQQPLPQGGPASACSPGRQHTCDLPLSAPWPASSQVGRPTSCYYMSSRQSLARLCAARLRAWRPCTQLAAMPSSADSLDRAAMHRTASTSSSAPGDGAAEKETCALPGCDLLPSPLSLCMHLSFAYT